MKTIEEFINEIKNPAELLEEWNAVKDEDELAEFMKKNGCEGTVEEFVKALTAAAEAEGEISDESAETAAGGIQAGWLDRHVRTEFHIGPIVTTQLEIIGHRHPDVL